MTTLTLTTGTVGYIPSMSPLDQAVIGFLANYSNDGTRRAYQHALQLYFTWCADQGIEPLQATRPQITLYLRWMETRGWSESTIAGRFTALTVFYKYAVIDDLIIKDPTLGVVKPKVDGDKQKRTFLNPIAFSKFIDAAASSTAMGTAMVALLGLRAMRIAEACSLDIEHSLSVDQGRWILTYVSKGGKLRRHPIAAQVVVALQGAIGDRTHGPILLNNRGNRMTRSNATRLIRHIADRAGVDTDISPHSLRRSFITTGAVMGVPLHEIQITVGHAQISTTAIYDRLASSHNRDRSQEIAGFLATLAG